MTKQNQIYKCEVCGGLLEVLVSGGEDLICCGEKMKLLEEKTEDVGREKHVPVIEKTANGIKVKVGAAPHPMEEKHYIQFIEVIYNGRSYKKFLKPGDKPEAEFEVPAEGVVAREHCNIHGLWKS
ncbi:MAG: desulfoferrodoxin [Candidatus Pacebacteria bacterium]|nr:desulfoferrodoxin [Candidatus Paceibacterota bacterium]NUQ57186.1 desulfoferrodoxin [Candidatus Paceibacter sp.]